MSLEDISKLLSDVSIKLRTLDQFKEKYGSLLAPDFFIMDYLNNYETGLSSIFAELLNPKGSHAQGTLFIESFISTAGLDDYWKKGIENVEVKSEVLTEYGRPDIVIDYKDGRAIIIENKPWASDQKDQLQRYTDYGKAQYKNWVLIYISNNEPTSIEDEKREPLEKDHKFKQIKYNEEIISWLEQTSSKVKPLHLRVFLEELCRWIDKNINGRVPMEESREIIEAITKDPDSLKSAFYIYNTFPQIQDKLTEDLNRKLSQEIKEAGFSLFSNEKLGKKRYDSINIDITPKKERDVKLYVRFEFGAGNYGDFFWGISVRGRLLEELKRNHEDTNAKAREIMETNEDIWREVKSIMDEKFSNGKYSFWWPWYDEDLNKTLGEGYKNWSENVEPWIDIFEGKLSEKIIELSRRVKEAFESKNRLYLFYSLKYD